ncbi:hypothetical protein Scep_010216 [Stephania cephalantha]|uniref:Uncharacterized protein n=1 Tax=Stephania cephalantha TaxID=152367 RepID=A0AAP0JWV3_9MAGN
MSLIPCGEEASSCLSLDPLPKNPLSHLFSLHVSLVHSQSRPSLSPRHFFSLSLPNPNVNTTITNSPPPTSPLSRCLSLLLSLGALIIDHLQICSHPSFHLSHTVAFSLVVVLVLAAPPLALHCPYRPLSRPIALAV